MAGVDGDRVLAPVGLAEMKRIADGVGKQVEARTRGAGKAHGFDSRPRRMLAEIRFVEDLQSFGGGRGKAGVGGPGLAGVGDFQQQVCGFNLPDGALDALRFDPVGRFADPGGID